jgi:hypothetical protein
MNLLAILREMHAAHAIDPAPGNQTREANAGSISPPTISAQPAAVAESDPAMALEALHQACRKSLVAHRLAAGWRPAGSNKHALMATYGRAALANEFLQLGLERRQLVPR